jgi:hypothetical protein
MPRQGTNWVFTGFVFGVEDGNSYLAKMLSGAAGSWLFRTPYTASPQSGVLAFLPYLLLGKLAVQPGLHLQLVALFHLFRVGAGFLAIQATYDFLAFFVHDPGLRRFGLLLAILGGGLGWILILAGQGSWLDSLPLDFYSPETFGFLGLYGIPHLSLARAALLWGLLAYLKAAQANRRSPGWRCHWREALKAGFWWLLAALAQPLTALVLAGVIGLHLLSTGMWIASARQRTDPQQFPPSETFDMVRKPSAARSRRIRQWKGLLSLACMAAILPAPFLAYNSLAFTLDPFLKAWTGQNRILSPHPLHYLLAYGLLLPFAFFGARRLFRLRPWDALLLVPWVIALPILAYAPFNLQRRLPEGIWIALVILAVSGLEGVWAGDREARHRPLGRWFSLPLLLAFPSTLILLAGGWLTVLRPALPVFRPAAEVAAFQFLQEHARPGEVILSAYESGNPLPTWAPVRVVNGHAPESAHLAHLQPLVVAFFDTHTPDSTRLDLLRKRDETTFSTDLPSVLWGLGPGPGSVPATGL